MTTLRGRIRDGMTGRPLEARVRVVAAGGDVRAPDGALHKVGNGDAFFYSEGAFEVEVSRGQTDVIVERGTEYLPRQVQLDAPAAGAVELDLELERWTNLADTGWYAGNTHVHYDEHETRAEERLRLDPPRRGPPGVRRQPSVAA